MDKLQQIQEVIHRYKYDPDFEEAKGSLEDLQVEWLVKQCQTLKEQLDIALNDYHSVCEESPKHLKVKSGYITKIAYMGNEYTIIHPTKRR